MVSDGISAKNSFDDYKTPCEVEQEIDVLKRPLSAYLIHAGQRKFRSLNVHQLHRTVHIPHRPEAYQGYESDI